MSQDFSSYCHMLILALSVPGLIIYNIALKILLDLIAEVFDILLNLTLEAGA